MRSSIKPRRLASLLQLVVLSFRQRKQLYIFITFSLISLGFIITKLLWSGSNGDGGVTGKDTRFDRETEEGLLLEHERVLFPPLDELIDRDRLWPPNLDKPLCDLKIYVYDLPPSLSLTSAQIQQCRWSAYSSELILHSLLTSPKTDIPSALVTTDPSLADAFFIPLFPACYLFHCWVQAGWNRTLRCGVDEDYIVPVMTHIKTLPWWEKRGGSDHIIVHPMDHADGYHKESSRLAMNSSVHLVTVGDLRPTPYSQPYRRHRDIVIPSSTHLLNSYYLNPRDYLDEFGHPLAERIIPKEEPQRSEIWVPSQNERKRGGWKAGRAAQYFISRKSDPPSKGDKNLRTTTAIFRGGIGQPDEGESYSLSIRTLFFPSTNTTSPHLSHPGFSSLPAYDIALSSPNAEYAHALSRSRFGLVPPGYTLDTTRLWEYLAFGIVPVFIGTGPSAGQFMPFQDDFLYSDFSIFIPRRKAHKLEEILSKVGEEEYERLRKGVWDVGRRLVLEEGRGEVWKWIGRDLCRMLGKGMGAGERTDWFG